MILKEKGKKKKTGLYADATVSLVGHSFSPLTLVANFMNNVFLFCCSQDFYFFFFLILRVQADFHIPSNLMGQRPTKLHLVA